jgi:hypothetical protein
MAATATSDFPHDARGEISHRTRGTFAFARGLNHCRVPGCGKAFGNAFARRRHERRAHERPDPPGTDLDGSNQPGDIGEIPDPLDNPDLKGDALRTVVNRRLRELAGLPPEAGP